MKHYDFDIGIIGAEAAGLTIASGAAQLGARHFLLKRSSTSLQALSVLACMTPIIL
jgi:pyruvate/2-oxoglutarate dehydrogenase complex dihydrolipoamide dehydrogenase (E3) component